MTKRSRRAAAAIKHRKVHLCLATGKRSYRDRRQARDALLAASWDRQQALTHGYTSSHREVRAYRCAAPECGQWHLTSMTEWVRAS